MSALEPWAKAWMESGSNPLLFAEGVMGYGIPGREYADGRDMLEEWQAAFLRDFFLAPSGGKTGEPRHSVRSGHGCGKTTTIAILALWFILTHYDAKCVVTAASQDQLRDGAWAEIRKQYSRLPEALRSQLEMGEERCIVKAAPEMGFIVRRTAAKSNPQALAGIHAKHVLYLIDEASGIDDLIFETAAGSLSTHGAMAALFSNPTKTSGFFFDTHNKMRDRWRTLRVNSEDVPRARGHISDIEAAFGKGSNRYRVRVLGEFPTADDQSVIALEHVESAVGRAVTGTLVRPVAGLDIARFGDDANCLVLRQGNRLLREPIEWRGVDLMTTTGRVVNILNSLEEDEKPAEIMVDSIGLGAGVADRLRELGYRVNDVNVGESPSVSERFMRLRDELWFAGRDWFEQRNVSIPRGCDKLISELTAPTYTFTSAGKIVVESKAELKKRGVASPNQADALLLSFAGGMDRSIQPLRRRTSSSRPAWAA